MALQEKIDWLVGETASMTPASYGDHKRQRDLYGTLDIRPSSGETLTQIIADYISKQIRPSVSSNSCPPLQVIIYAIRSILNPTFVFQEIPNLLKLLVHLEVVRQAQVRTMRTLLHKQKELLLPLDTIDRLERRTKESVLEAHRGLYRNNIHGCCLLVCVAFCFLSPLRHSSGVRSTQQHIHYLWRNYDPDVDRPLHDVLVTYFPALAKRDPDLRDKCDEALETCPWNHDLSEDELVVNADWGREAVQFMVGAALYEDDPEGYCQQRGSVPSRFVFPFTSLLIAIPRRRRKNTTTLEELFPPPNSQEIAEGIERSIATVSKSAGVLDAILE